MRLCGEGWKYAKIIFHKKKTLWLAENRSIAWSKFKKEEPWLCTCLISTTNRDQTAENWHYPCIRPICSVTYVCALRYRTTLIKTTIHSRQLKTIFQASKTQIIWTQPLLSWKVFFKRPLSWTILRSQTRLRICKICPAILLAEDSLACETISVWRKRGH